MITESVKNDRGIWEPMACLNYDEAGVLQKLLPIEIKKSKKYVERYRDIQDGGEATERQQAKLMLAEEYDDMLNSLNKCLNNYISDFERETEETE